MEAKSFLMAMGLGVAAGTAMGMMLPRNREMERLGKRMAHEAAETVTKAVDSVEQKLT
jgi:hypothetical protein